MGSELQRTEKRGFAREPSMTIDSRCKEQRDVADIILTNFNSAAPGSKGQVQALSTLSFLLGMWSDFLKAEQRRMKFASSLKATSAL